MSILKAGETGKADTAIAVTLLRIATVHMKIPYHFLKMQFT